MISELTNPEVRESERAAINVSIKAALLWAGLPLPGKSSVPRIIREQLSKPLPRDPRISTSWEILNEISKGSISSQNELRVKCSVGNPNTFAAYIHELELYGLMIKEKIGDNFRFELTSKGREFLRLFREDLETKQKEC